MLWPLYPQGTALRHTEDMGPDGSQIQSGLRGEESDLLVLVGNRYLGWDGTCEKQTACEV
jgi:hypothetical protein